MAKKAKVTATSVEPKSTSSILGTFSGKCCDAAVFNNNSMKLNRELFENLINSDEYKDAMAHRYYIGYLGHPEDPGAQTFQDACIVMTSMELRDNDEIWGTFDLIDTPVGRIVKSFIDAGVQWGISIRGAGDVDSEGNVDPDTFVFRGFDLVAFPAYDDAVPQFRQIAASKNLDDQVKYKRVCAAIDKNLSKVASIHSIEAMQEQFNPDSVEYKKLENRKEDIGVDDECPECTKEDREEILGKKLQAMTNMYLAEHDKNKELQNTLASIQTKYRRELRSIKRITASQNDLMQSKLQNINKSKQELKAENRGLVVANKRLETKLNASEEENSEITKELDLARKNNLIYKQKVESSSADIKARDSQIAELQKKLNKTVVASTNATKEASNRGEQINNLKAQISSSTEEFNQELDSMEARILAAEEMIHEYQQAYANIYANAIGVQVSGLSVTASTSVGDLEQLIQGATNTANIGLAPSYEDIEEVYPVDGDIEDGGNDLAVL